MSHSHAPPKRDARLRLTTEDTGANTETDKQYIYNLYTELLKNVQPLPGMTKTESYEEEAKKLFKKQPANMKLLVVVDKLLTGFDAPSCTYLYIDKSMQDHGLFQAICRTNRLDGEDKTVGCIVDYKNLFNKLVNDKGTGALQVYTSELATEDSDGADPQVLMQERLAEGKKRLDEALEGLAALCEPIEPPRTELEAIHYFCGDTEKPEDLKEREPYRVGYPVELFTAHVYQTAHLFEAIGGRRMRMVRRVSVSRPSPRIPEEDYADDRDSSESDFDRFHHRTEEPDDGDSLISDFDRFDDLTEESDDRDNLL